MRLSTSMFAVFILVAPAAAQTVTSVKINYFACKTESELSRGDGIRASGDQAALKLWIQGALLSGVCIWMRTGTPVYREGYGSAGMVKIRPQGDISSYFTFEPVLN